VINQNTDRIVSSTLKRAIETAAIISEKTGIEYNLQIPELNEFAPGSLPLKEKGIIRLLKSRRWPAFVRKYLNSILYSGLSIYYFNQWYRGRTKGGDTMESIDRRINSVLNRLDDLPERRIAIVGHGYWFIFLALKIYGYKKRNILRLRWINNCSVTRIATNGNGDYTLISFARRHI
ncbi:histidine phosphatase family protein, partial [bacterium]|nr:histidine phosphatase family protein [bacterium]